MQKIEVIEKIHELTGKGLSRRIIAKNVNLSKTAVYKYQKKLELI